MNWKTIAEEKSESLHRLIPKEWRMSDVPSPEKQPNVSGKYLHQFLTPREVEITESDAVDIVQNTSTGQWKAKEVTLAFCHRAALAHQLVSCLHEIFFDQAIQDAERLDAHFEKYGKPIGPLHGLPVSLKDSINVKGVETTLGFVGWIGTFEGDKNSDKYKKTESTIATHLRALGAVLYIKTSVPQASCNVETANNIIGYTLNPHNRKLTAGGSSGGEGALIGLRGSVAGLGTDIGASIRLPSNFNGLHGLRPSFHRLPLKGISVAMDGEDTVPFVVGPMATTSRSVALLMKSLLGCKPWLSDPMVPELPWRDETYTETLKRLHGAGQKLTFGILRTDGMVNPQPPVVRALATVEAAIRRGGHEVIEFMIPNYTYGLQLFSQAAFIDGGADVVNQLALTGEPPDAAMVPAFHSKSPNIMDATQVMRVNRDLRAYRADFLDHWNETASRTATGQAIDAVIMPITPSPATRRGRVKGIGKTPLHDYIPWIGDVRD
jgi:amidase